MADELEPTERSRVLNLLRENVNLPAIGEVQETFPHTGDETRPSNHEVTVAVPPGDNPESTFKRVPVAVATSGVVSPPTVGDKVLLVFPRGGESPIITGTLYADAPEDRAPEAAEDTLRATRGDLYAELAGDGSTARLAKKAGDQDQPTAKVEVQNDGTVVVESATQIDISVDGSATISATGSVSVSGSSVTVDGGSVTLANGGSAVAREGDSVETILASGSITSGSSDVDSS